MVTNNAINIATGASGTILRGAGVGVAPTFSTATYPATAGTSGNVLTSDGTNWASSAPTGGGKLVQVVYASISTVQTGTTTIPNDDTIPQNTEGTEFLTLAVTPTSSTNNLVIEARFNVSHTAGPTSIIGALFQDSTANALAVSAITDPGANVLSEMTFYYKKVSGTTSSTTFKIRIGNDSASTVTINGSNSARKFGGVYSSWIQISEIAP